MAMGRPSPIGPHPAGVARHFPERIGAHTSLDEHLPVDHRLSTFYRVGAGLMGLVLVAFGILGLIDQVGFFDIGGDTVAGLNTNGALSVLSIVIGLLLFVGMVIGGNFASTLNLVLGILFLLSGFINLAVLETTFNFLAFRMQNVLFSFVVGLLLMWFGMYGRVSGGLPHDNPYWVTRHPEQAEREAVLARDLIAARGRAAEQTGTAAPPGTPLTPGAAGGPVTAGAGAEGGRESAERRGEPGERRGAAEESGERRGQPPGKWGKLDQPGGAEPIAEPTDQPDKPGSHRWARFLRRPRSR
ncbi:hypothetical protein ADL28_28815 [Streptomyces violaceusniger]|uniref:DUF4383 domain-containing protein n=3 Tax=Streptomyces TaxID=1883 RepID=A0ABD5JCL8_9ACTN|nr:MULTISPECIES: DUF4383 domain-containing protein [Streptomyces]KUL48609.1 hypothetical protein ADL28_28815 [Streptomyces violaceusniger]MEE4586130.1 DUF4383 domain-containing protein [Streptomyces sp. DSM 41602]WJD99870.1 DUF4383 domain-containing protein [Streptomyces antimycoticus]WTB08162.1 DUF4383 domain-containing protein [Streptomyces antimycoticus]